MESLTSKRNVGLIILVILLGVVLAGLLIPQLPTPLGLDSSGQEYAADRAWQHLEVIGETPSALGTEANNQVREYIYDYLVSLGVETERQATTAYSPSWRTAGEIQNILAKVPGSDSTLTIGLVANYDSLQNVPGVSNAKSGVASMLEIARVLQNGPQLKNDIVFLFVDGGEVGMLGAQAFIDEHPWAEELDLVINVVARGTTGPVKVTETSRNNGWLIQEFGEAVSKPYASSLTNSINRWILNDTSFFVFQQAGIPGFSLSHNESPRSYQTVLDNLENLDLRTLQHQGSTIFSLINHFGNLEEMVEAPTDQVYFDLFGKFFVDYPLAWVAHLLTGVLILFGFTIWYGLKDKKTSFKNIAFGLLTFVVVGFICIMVLSIISYFIKPNHSLYQHVPLHNGLTYFGAGIALLTAIVSGAYLLAFKKLDSIGLILGIQIGWLIATVFFTLFMPGSSYLFLWPLIFSLVGVLIKLRWPDISWKLQALILVITSLPILLLWPPALKELYLMLGLGLIGLLALLVVLALGLLMPQLRAISEWNKLIIPIGALLVFGVCVGVIAVTGGYDHENPKMNSLLYHVDYDQERGFWLSIDDEPDQYSGQVIKEPFSVTNLGEFIPYEDMPVLAKAAKIVGTNPVSVSLVAEELNEEQEARVLEIVISAENHINNIIVFMESEKIVGNVKLNDELDIDIDEYWPVIRYYNLPSDGIRLSIPVTQAEEFTFQVVSQAFGFPAEFDSTIMPRPADLIPAPTGITDSSFTVRTYQF